MPSVRVTSDSDDMGLLALSSISVLGAYCTWLFGSHLLPPFSSFRTYTMVKRPDPDKRYEVGKPITLQSPCIPRHIASFATASTEVILAAQVDEDGDWVDIQFWQISKCYLLFLNRNIW